MPLSTTNEIKLYYDVIGQGPAVCLINGYRLGSAAWPPLFITRLAIRCTVLTFDNRGTGQSDKPATGYEFRNMARDVIELLDDYFDAIVSPIQENKGDILKFIGAGVLAIFPTEDDEDFAPSSLRALAAATQGLERLAAINQARRETERTEVRTGIGLHLGEVIYGNVGSPDRLDFTVIGPAVNLASRIEGLTKRLLRALLTSAAFAKICPRPLVSLGFQPVRGLFEPEEVFGLPD